MREEYNNQGTAMSIYFYRNDKGALNHKSIEETDILSIPNEYITKVRISSNDFDFVSDMNTRELVKYLERKGMSVRKLIKYLEEDIK